MEEEQGPHVDLCDHRVWHRLRLAQPEEDGKCIAVVQPLETRRIFSSPVVSGERRRLRHGASTRQDGEQSGRGGNSDKLTPEGGADVLSRACTKSKKKMKTTTAALLDGQVVLKLWKELARSRFRATEERSVRQDSGTSRRVEEEGDNSSGLSSTPPLGSDVGSTPLLRRYSCQESAGKSSHG